MKNFTVGKGHPDAPEHRRGLVPAVEPLVHRSAGADEGEEDGCGDDGADEEHDYHQIGEGARRHIRVLVLVLPRPSSPTAARSSSSPPASHALAKTPTQNGERSKRGWARLLRRYLIPSHSSTHSSPSRAYPPPHHTDAWAHPNIWSHMSRGSGLSASG